MHQSSSIQKHDAPSTSDRRRRFLFSARLVGLQGSSRAFAPARMGYDGSRLKVNARGLKASVVASDRRRINALMAQGLTLTCRLGPERRLDIYAEASAQ